MNDSQSNHVVSLLSETSVKLELESDSIVMPGSVELKEPMKSFHKSSFKNNCFFLILLVSIDTNVTFIVV